MILSTLASKGELVFVVLIIIGLTPYTVLAYSDNSLTIVIKDSKTGIILDGTSVYLDGAFQGGLSRDSTGMLYIPDIQAGTHTLRIAQNGYREATTKFDFPTEKKVEVGMDKGSLVSLNRDGPAAYGINVIFIPSGTSYNCSNNQKVPETLYITNESRFREDVLQIINRTYMNLDQVTSPSVPLPEQYQNRFNFYYYYNPAVTADAFSGCAGNVQDRYWDEVTSGDITVILYPTYYGRYSNSSSQPAGCYQAKGPGRRLMKAPADKWALFAHETGHAVFGLVDTYCGNTYYYQNSPNPNVWSSMDTCRTDAQANSRNITECRPIKQQSPVPCLQPFWHWDSDPDIMDKVYSGTFGAAATQRIRYILMQAGGVSS